MSKVPVLSKSRPESTVYLSTGKSMNVVLIQLEPLSVDFRMNESAQSLKTAITTVSPLASIA